MLTFIAQILFAIKIQDIKPSFTIVNNPPSKKLVQFLSFGDYEFYFRILALKVQNFGDRFGLFTPLKKYNYQKLYQWLKVLDNLNHDSRFTPSLVSYYYSQTQNKRDNIYLIKYLVDYYRRNKEKNWWWMYQAFYISYFNLQNLDISSTIANELSLNKNAPLWVNKLPILIYKSQNKDCQIFFTIQRILKDYKHNIEEKRREITSMKLFFDKHLNNLKEKKFNPSRCKKNLLD